MPRYEVEETRSVEIIADNTADALRKANELFSVNPGDPKAELVDVTRVDISKKLY